MIMFRVSSNKIKLKQSKIRSRFKTTISYIQHMFISKSVTSLLGTNLRRIGTTYRNTF